MTEQTKTGNRLDHFEKEDLDRKLVEEGSFIEVTIVQAEEPPKPQQVAVKPDKKPEDMDDFEKEDLEAKLVDQASFTEPQSPTADDRIGSGTTFRPDASKEQA